MIEPGKPHDLDALMKIELEAFQSDQITPRQMESYLAFNLDRHFLLVSRSEGQPAHGYILVLIRRGSKVGRIHSYAVADSARGMGIGALLIEAAADMARTGYGCHELRTEVRVDNPHALARYEKSFFRRVGKRRSYYSDGCDSYSYKRRLK